MHSRAALLDSYHSITPLLLLVAHGPDRRRMPAQAIPKCWTPSRIASQWTA